MLHTTTSGLLRLSLLAALLAATQAPATTWQELDSHQKSELRLMQARHLDEGTDAVQARAERDELLRSWGLAAPAAGQGLGRGQGARGFCQDLSQEQRQQLWQLRQRLESEGAGPAAMRAEHDKLLRSWGLEPPAAGRGRGPGACGVGMDLTKEQRQQLWQLRQRLESEGAEPAAIRTEHDQLLRSWGLEPPVAGPSRGRGPGACGVGMDLTKEQRQQLWQLRQRLESEGAEPEAIRAEHDKLLRSWGVTPPARGGRGPCGKGLGGGGTPSLETGEGAASPTAAGTVGHLLRGNHPNPFNPETVIRFALSEAGPVKLQIHDVEGRLVRTLVDGPQAAGEHQAVWKGDGEDGRPVASGTYFHRLETGGRLETGRMTLLR
ncbi:MAG: FlgD immunoglobulin-like domain containing protein [bacterium]|jgi:Spy/CpxP family protein refolding chaperone|nr:FlgD immunoglobulin-like domain containing protein [bacterium]